MKETELLSEPSISRERIPFLLESSRTSYEELIFRIKHRDDWLKIQLLAQVTMLALAFGIEIGGVKATSSIPNVLALAIPTAFILACLYVVEDNLVGYLSRERAKFALTEARMFPKEDRIDLWEASDSLRNYARTTLPIRFAAQLGAFVLIPAGLALYRYWGITAGIKLYFIESIVDALLWCATLGIIIWAFRKRQLTGTVEKIERSSYA